MDEPRFHPLVVDTDEDVAVPMFMSTDGESIRKVHDTYLSEIVSNYFRLHSRKPVSNSLDIRCPRCGTSLYQVATATKNTLGLYSCRNCSKNGGK